MPPGAGQVIQAHHLNEAISKMLKRSATHVDGWRREDVWDLRLDGAKLALLSCI